MQYGWLGYSNEESCRAGHCEEKFETVDDILLVKYLRIRKAFQQKVLYYITKVLLYQRDQWFCKDEFK